MLMPVPTQKDMKGMVIAAAPLRTFVHSRSSAPMIRPRMNGTRAATKAMIGMSPRPEAPRKMSARNGPSSNALAT